MRVTRPTNFILIVHPNNICLREHITKLPIT